MGNKLIVLNHKMNLTAKEVKDYLLNISANKNVVMCPTAIYIPYFLAKDFQVGIQNISANDKGAYTGQIGVSQVRSLGVNYVIIGHSEIREYLGDTDELINQKVIKTLENHVNVILCIGEKTRKRGFEKVVKEQIKKALTNVGELEHVFIAYEPIWAIGTGITPTNEQIKDTTVMIKKYVKDTFKYENIKVLYGGSVSDVNIEELNKIDVIDGYLVGGASLDLNKVKKIIEVVS
jgi:triosephosphate isomerase (TIM)